MTAFPLVYQGYKWRGADERLTLIGDGETTVLFLAPFFEEANRLRHLMIMAMHALAARGVRCLLPDLPGTLESPTPLSRLDWDDWTGAIALAAGQAGPTMHVASIRSGCLFDSYVSARSVWRLSPQDGPSLWRELVRLRMAADREAGLHAKAADIESEAARSPFSVAGHLLAPQMTAQLKQSLPAPATRLRTARLTNEAREADIYFTAKPLWRQAEPSHDPALCAAIAADIAAWIGA